MGIIEEFIFLGYIKRGGYALIASGFVLIFVVAGILNLAPGTFCMLGACIAYSLIAIFRLPQEIYRGNAKIYT